MKYDIGKVHFIVTLKERPRSLLIKCLLFGSHSRRAGEQRASGGVSLGWSPGESLLHPRYLLTVAERVGRQLLQTERLSWYTVFVIVQYIEFRIFTKNIVIFP